MPRPSLRPAPRGRLASILAAALLAALPAAAGAAAPAAPAEPHPAIDPSPVVPSEAREVVSLYRATHRIGYGVVIPDGYADGGRGMRLGRDGRPSSSREVLVVDRGRDEVLRKALEFAGSDEVRGLPTAERMRRIANYVSTTFDRQRGRVVPFANDEQLANACRSQGVLVGAVPSLCNMGVCRHESLFFKLMADEAGLNAALVRGGYQKPGRDRPGAHAWCEVEQDDGSLVVVDTMRSKSWFVTMSDPRAPNYRDMSDRPLYGPAGRLQHLAIVAVGTTPFVDAATIRIVPPGSGGQVRYTLDGSEPTAESPVADGPLSIPGSCIVKAVAFGADGAVVDRASRQVVVIATRPAGHKGAAAVPSVN